MILFRSRSQKGRGRWTGKIKSKSGRRRRVLLDTNVLMSAFGFKSKYPKKAIAKSMRFDKLKHTDVVDKELRNHIYGKSKNEQKMKSDIEKGLEKIPDPEKTNTIEKEELARRYPEINEKDRKIVHAVKSTRSDILVSGDKGLIKETKRIGLKAVTPKDYVEKKKKRLGRNDK